MLQKLEDFYLAILRFVVILVAGILLVAVALLAVRSVDALSPPPEPTKATPAVSQSELKKSILSVSDSQPGATSPSGTETDPNQSYYNHAGASIKTFFDTHFAGQYNIDSNRLADFVKERASTYESAEIKSAYAKNLSESIDLLLADKDLIAYAKLNEPGPAIDQIVNSFTEEFNRQITETETANQAKQDSYLAEKAQSQRNLYMAASAFGIFLLIVFLSIIIRIERNLRPQNRSTA